MMSHQRRMSLVLSDLCCDDVGVRTGTGESGEQGSQPGVRGHEVTPAQSAETQQCGYLQRKYP